MRGLYAAWNHTDPTSDMAKFIEAYVTVQVSVACSVRAKGGLPGNQYNALQDLATSPGTNEYSSAWSGPPVPELLPWGQLDALEVMK